ncbi:uncharacterized protein B0H18DRAFT_1129561 [Fomitopsis serialis]|uniref:uncharacterized protein n=1 Tax=Fomitopsis serialis TaxID=139415 RepID=UPI002007AB44|nr:uncharacterized protein B0H18DRAFT_1129561 [Neoantrodia serialis]KAH9910775.1 hypothetical protein B0H18DRAFT_1129561 [Neoantrodia serialis]
MNTRSNTRPRGADDTTAKKTAAAPKTARVPSNTSASKSKTKRGKKRDRGTDDEAEHVDERGFSKKDAELLKQLEYRKRQADKQKEVQRRSKIQRDTAAMTAEEQEDDEDAQEERPKRKRSRKVVGSEDDEEQSGAEREVTDDAAAAEDEEGESPEEDELEPTPPKARSHTDHTRDVKGKGRARHAAPQDEDVDMEGSHDEREDAPLSDEDEQLLAASLRSAQAAKTPSKKKTNSDKGTRGKNVRGDDEDGTRSGVSTRNRAEKAGTRRVAVIEIASPPRKSAADRNAKGKAVEKKEKIPAWLATSVSDDAYGEGSDDSGGDDEDESEHDVVLVKGQKGKANHPKPKATGAARTRGRAQMRDLPDEVKSVVTKAHSYLRLRISLEHAWTWEKMTNIDLLPEKYVLIKRAVNDVRELCGADGKPLTHFALGFKKLNGDGKDTLRNKVFDVVWTAATQLRNELKNKAKVVVDEAYGLNHLSGPRKVSAASFLLKGNHFLDG